MSLATLITIDELKQQRQEWEGQRVAFVPTMGALHEGHLSLVQRARTLADKVIVSIFVNPTQFGPNEDFATYPRTLEEDLEKLAAAQVDAVFLPNSSEIYPPHFQTYVVNNEMAGILCGASRQGHFRGVLTVVMKLLQLVKPHVAVFGKKDYQQWRLIERMVHDLAVGVEIVGEKIMREKDGLAMSSRNRRLTPENRKVAVQLHKGLEKVQEKFLTGLRQRDALLKVYKDHVAQFPEIQLEYVEIRVQEALQETGTDLTGPAVILVAARLGEVRLIDNKELGATS